jgi:hypothetical protein
MRETFMASSGHVSIGPRREYLCLGSSTAGGLGVVRGRVYQWVSHTSQRRKATA